MAKKSAKTAPRAVKKSQALALHQLIASLLREFRLEPGMLAGSAYVNLHANDIGLFEVLTAAGDWTVNRVAEELRAPITTISSALDRLERRGLIERRRTTADRRVVLVELTAAGKSLANRLSKAHIENCAAMLARLTPGEREEFLRMAAQVAKPQAAKPQVAKPDTAPLPRTISNKKKTARG